MLTLSIQNLSVHFSGNHVINDVSATLHGGEMVAVVGRNGVGKTTLIKAIARLIKRSGDVALYDDKGNLFSDRDIAYVPQLESVTSRLTAFEMVLLGLVKDLRWKVTDEQIEKVADTLAELGLDSLSRKPVCSLSGGQKQLVFMAQAFVSRPKVLLLDEPTSALDLRHQLVVMDLARKYTRENGRLHFLSCMISCWRRDTAAVCSCFTRGGSRPLIRPNGCCTRTCLATSTTWRRASSGRAPVF